jgi:cytidine deaminase
MLTDKIIDFAIEAAHKSESDLFRHGAVIYDKDRVLAVGWNVLGKTDSALFYNQYGTFHAESLAIFRAYGGRVRKGNKKVYMFVVRINRHGEFRLSKPCPACEKLLRKNRIIVYYSTENGIEKYIP